MKYKVGEKVKVREDLEVGKEYNDTLFINDMLQYKGKIAIITYVSDDDSYYEIDLDDGEWAWTDKMFEIITHPRNTIDVGYHLDDYGNRILKNVWYKGIRKDIGRIYFSDNVDINQYVLPTDAIDFIIPHED